MKFSLLKEISIITEAALSPAQLTKYFNKNEDRTRLDAFVKKMKSGGKFEMMDKKAEPVVLKKDTKFIKAIGKLKPGDKFPKVQLYTKDGDKIAFSKLKKTDEFGAPSEDKIANKGDVAEGILGAALATKFSIRSPRTVTVKEIEAMIDTLVAGKDKTMAVNDKHENKDQIVLRVNLAERPMRDLLNKDKRHMLKSLIASSAKYVNTVKVSKYAEAFYNNNIGNKIEVTSDGLSDQKGTKADITVKVDDKVVHLNISLKAEAVKQFGQVGGSEFEKQVTLWNKLAGIDVKSKKRSYNRNLAEKGPVEAIDRMYNHVVTQINKQLKGDNDKKEFNFIKKFGKGVDFFATRGEKGMTLVHMHKGDFEELSFKGLEAKLKKIDLAARMKKTGTLPIVQIYDKKSDKNLLSIRVMKQTGARGGHYIRNVIEKEPLLVEILKVEKEYGEKKDDKKKKDKKKKDKKKDDK